MDKDYEEFENLNLLYVEDDIWAQEVIAGILENYFKKVFVANNGEEGFNIFQNEKIDVIITDLEMPKTNGVSLISKIRDIDFHIPLIVFTAYTDKAHLLPCANYNIQGYIEKPLNEEKITNIFNNLLSYISTDLNDDIELAENIIYVSNNSKLIKNDEDIKLSKKEKILLDLLILNKNHLVSYDQIELKIWQDFDEVMTGTALRTLVKSLRQKTDKNIIQNVSGMGYLLKLK